MIRKFDENTKLEYRALQIWQILVGAAHNRQILTYIHVAKLIGYKGSGTLSRQLGHIMYLCDKWRLPPLTIIVVNQEDGKPGCGLILDGDENELREEVYKYDWYNLIPPTTDELAKAWASNQT
ncbi:hypothetical protein [uncultured Vibrio sp.]|uniref:hypothetical protein n=1 Tax=uncultured Vibrio sp. TaxID=114054 RepID=UPI002622EE6D|nr:hypothetical protein [uncultured Vibrio sp.]